MNRIRDLVLKDPTALRYWHLVVDDLVWAPSEKNRVKELLREFKYEHAVLESLVIFEGARDRLGDVPADLIEILGERGLGELADRIREQFEDEGLLQCDVPYPDPRDLMKLMSYLAPNISVELLEKLYTDGDEGLDAKTQADLTRSLETLQATGVLEVQNGIVSVLRTVSRIESPDEEADTIEFLRDILEKELGSAATHTVLKEECAAHSMALISLLLHYDDLVLDSWPFLLHAAVQIQSIGDHRALLSFTEQAARKLASVFGERHEHTLEMRRRMGEARLLWGASELSEGQSESARVQFGRAVKVLEPLLPVAVEELGQSHLVTILTRDSLARAYNGKGEYDQGLMLAKENVRLNTSSASVSLGPASEMTILLMLTKGIVLFTMGRLSYAIPVLEFVVREGSTRPGVAARGISVAKGLLTMAVQETEERKKAVELESPLRRSVSHYYSRLVKSAKKERKHKMSTTSL